MADANEFVAPRFGLPRLHVVSWPGCSVDGSSGRREAAGVDWLENGLVFNSEVGTPMDAANVRRAFRHALGKAEDIEAAEWTPRELRHSFVSLLSDHDVPVEEIAKLVGHSATATTEKVYRKQIRPVIQTGAKAMDRIFGA